VVRRPLVEEPREVSRSCLRGPFAPARVAVIGGRLGQRIVEDQSGDRALRRSGRHVRIGGCAHSAQVTGQATWRRSATRTPGLLVPDPEQRLVAEQVERMLRDIAAESDTATVGRPTVGKGTGRARV
jgi:hypothetical protein